MDIDITDLRRLPGDRPPARPLIAVGDIHGHSDALHALQEHLRGYISEAYGDELIDVVYLGDYIDRGPDPLGSLELVRIGLEMTNVKECAIMGNHDWFLVEAAALRGMEISENQREMWLNNGGMQTLTAMGLTARASSADIREALGSDGVAALLQMVRYFRTGGILCVHAGVDPLIPLQDQTAHDLMWIREPFLSAGAHVNGAWPIGLTIVHGHTPSSNGIYANRIGVDTGGFQTGVFSAIEMTQEGVRFHRITK